MQLHVDHAAALETERDALAAAKQLYVDHAAALETERNVLLKERDALLAEKHPEAQTVLTPPAASSRRPTRRAAADRRLGFIHIPKTAGSSVVEKLREFFADELLQCSVDDFANFADYLGQVPVITGHVPFYLFEAERPRRKLFTVLRDPQQRIVSNYNYILTSPGHYARNYVRHYNLSLADCYAHPVLKIEFSNFQTRMLGWTPSLAPVIPAVTKEELAQASLDRSEYLISDLSRDALDLAKNRLRDQVSFGIIEDHRSLDELLSSMIDAPPGDLRVINKTPPTGYAPTSADVEAIANNNLLDQELYEFAKSLLKQRRTAPSRSAGRPRASRKKRQDK
jgi:hypothetical protein